MYGLLRDKKATYVTNHKRDWIHVQDVCTCHKISCSQLKAEKFGQGDLPVKEFTLVKLMIMYLIYP